MSWFPVGKKPYENLDDPGGIGLSNVRKRLALLYPGQHSLNIHSMGETFAVVLTINGLQIHPHDRKVQLLYH